MLVAMQNMITRILIGFAIITFVNSCEVLNLKENVQDCVKNKIKEFSKSSKICDQGASVYRYFFQDKYVYVFDPGNCRAEKIAEVFDENCNQICDLGGYMGNMICENTRFNENATDETLIWENK
jgi:hypothetical protein